MLTFIELVTMVAITVQILKTYAEQSFLKPENPVHDTTIRLVSIICGIAVLAANQRGVTLDSAAIEQLVYQGGAIGAAAVVGFHGAKALAPVAKGSN